MLNKIPYFLKPSFWKLYFQILIHYFKNRSLIFATPFKEVAYITSNNRAKVGIFRKNGSKILEMNLYLPEERSMDLFTFYKVLDSVEFIHSSYGDVFVFEVDLRLIFELGRLEESSFISNKIQMMKEKKDITIFFKPKTQFFGRRKLLSF